MSENLKITISQIDKFIRNNEWFDFHVWKYDGRSLVISGSIDLTYYHKLEIIFEDVFFVSAFFQEWHSDTSKTVIEIPDGEHCKTLNINFEIEKGYQIFIIRTEDYKNDIYIAAKAVKYNTDTVFYYQRENLEDGERLAEYLTKK